jgi:hypothetical protein
MPVRSLMMLLLLLAPAAAMAQDAWLVLPMAGTGVDRDVAETFRGLLEAELSSRSGARFVASGKPCGDMSCARKAGQAAGAGIVIYGRIGNLGSKLVVFVSAVDVAAGKSLSQQRMSIDQVEDLEQVALRVAEAITSGKTTDDTAALGLITEKETTPAKRREGASGLSLRLGGVSPVGDPYQAGFGILVDAGIWYEGNDFAIEPRVGYRFSTNTEEAGYRAFHGDFGAFWILGRGDFAPFIGGGAGVRFVGEDRQNVQSSGSVVRLTSAETDTEEQWGPGAFARVGVMFFRTYSVRMAIDLEYDATFVNLHEQGPPQSFNFGVRMIF